MSFENLTPDELAQRETLASRLDLLCRTIMAPDGQPVSYTKMRDWLSERHIKLGRSRWEYMRAGNKWLVTDKLLLSAIAEYFEIDPSYLIGPEGPLAETIDAALRFTLAERTSPVKLYAARTLGQDVSSEHLKRLTALLEEIDAERRQP
jgi:hypothetical protein